MDSKSRRSQRIARKKTLPTEEEKPEKKVDTKEESEDEDEEPEAISLSSAKQMALLQTQEELKSKKEYEKEKKNRARKLYRSDEVSKKEETKKDEEEGRETNTFPEDLLAEVNFDALESEGTLSKTHKRKRQKQEDVRPQKKIFGDQIQVVSRGSLSSHSVRPQTSSFLSSHFSNVPRSSLTPLQSHRRGAAASVFVK